MQIVQTLGFVFVTSGMSQTAAIMSCNIKWENNNDSYSVRQRKLHTIARDYLLYYHVCEYFGKGVLMFIK